MQAGTPPLAMLKLEHAIACATELRAAAAAKGVPRLRAALEAWERHAGIPAGFAARAAPGPDVTAALTAVREQMHARNVARSRCELSHADRQLWYRSSCQP